MDKECGIHERDGICLERLVGDLNVKNSLGRIRCRWESNVTVRLKKSQTVRV